MSIWRCLIINIAHWHSILSLSDYLINRKSQLGIHQSKILQKYRKKYEQREVRSHNQLFKSTTEKSSIASAPKSCLKLWRTLLPCVEARTGIFYGILCDWAYVGRPSFSVFLLVLRNTILMDWINRMKTFCNHVTYGIRFKATNLEKCGLRKVYGNCASS